MDRQTNGVLYLTSKNFDVGSLKLDKVDFLSEEDFQKLFSDTKKSQRRLRDGDVLTGIIGTFGNAYRYKEGDHFGISSSVAILRPNANILNSDFLYYVVTSTEFKSTVAAYKGGSVQGYTNIATLKSLPIPLPQLNKQKRIAEILKALDNKITLNRQLNQTLENMAQALFKSWFVDFDPVIDNALAAGHTIPDDLQDRAERRQTQRARPDHTPLPEDISNLFPNEFELTETLGWVPKGWEVKNLTDLVDTISKTYPLKEAKEVIFLNTGDIEAGLFLHNNYSDVGTLPGQAKKSIQKDDILFSEIRPKNRRYAYVNFDGSNHVVSTKLMVLRAKPEIDSKLIYFILTQNSCLDELQRIAELRSGTFPQITFNELAQIECPIPDNSRILSVFSRMMLTNFYNQQFQLQRQSEVLSNLRDTLLPKLISGELRIPEAQAQLEAVLGWVTLWITIRSP